MKSNISHAEFGARTTATEAARTFSEEIRGKIVLITGVSPNSIGEGLALALAAHQPGMLILASRTLSKIRVISRTIHASHPSVNVQEVVVDLSSLTSVREAADCCKRILEKEGKRLDVLFNNAGINLSERRLTEGGVEMQFATNHLGPFLLTNLLLPFMSTGKGGTRVVNTSSDAHRISPVRFSDVSPVGDLLVLQLGDIFPRYHDSALEQFRSTSEVADFLVTQINQTPGAKVDFEDEPRRGMPKGMLRGDGRYEPSVAYGQSKTANVLFSVALNRRGVKSFAVMPGTIATDLAREMDEQGIEGLTQGQFDWKSIDEGAATLVVAGFDPGLNDEAGVYLDDCQMKRPSKWASDVEKAERLWVLSEHLVGEKFLRGKASRI